MQEILCIALFDTWYFYGVQGSWTFRIIIRLIWTWCGTPVHFEGFRFEKKGTEVNFDKRVATWSGWVICSPPGPSGGPFKTHLLSGGAVPQVHEARSSVLPGLLHFATPRSVCLLATRLHSLTHYVALLMCGR